MERTGYSQAGDCATELTTGNTKTDNSRSETYRKTQDYVYKGEKVGESA
jgi:hypothetical protein